MPPLPADQGLVGRGVVRFDAQAAGARPVGVELPSQSQIDGQLRSGAPAVADVERVLVLEAVHLDELAALPRDIGRAEQKCRQAVPVVLERWRVSLESDGGVERVGVQGRHARIEIERAARAFAQFRLPVVHQVVDEVEAEPDVVRALHPACIGVEGVGLVVAEERIPAFRIAQR